MTYVRLRLRRNTSSEWAILNPVLLSGEIAFETDTGRLRVGDGISNWSDLDYYLPSEETNALVAEALANAGAGDGGAAQAALDAHIASQTPHPVYDDGPSLLLLYQNAKV